MRTIFHAPELSSEHERGDAASTATSKPSQNATGNAAILIFGLGLLSWVATYVGMMELIEANMGDLPIIHASSSAFRSPC